MMMLMMMMMMMMMVVMTMHDSVFGDLRFDVALQDTW